MRFEKLGEDKESAIYRVHLWPVDIREGLEATGTTRLARALDSVHAPDRFPYVVRDGRADLP